MAVLRIISGGQTGGDMGGLLAGRDLGIPTGGTAPLGYRTDEGPAPHLRSFGLVESSSASYPKRTEQNVVDSHGTLIFGDITSPGCSLTRRLCGTRQRSMIHVRWPYPPGEEREAFERAVMRFRAWCEGARIEILNVAGNRESSAPGITEAVRLLLVTALKNQNG